jgi:hypothetical protein
VIADMRLQLAEVIIHHSPSVLASSGLLTLPRPSRPVRCRPSMQVDGSSLSADVVAEWHESERLAVNLAVNQPLHCRTPPLRWYGTGTT